MSKKRIRYPLSTLGMLLGLVIAYCSFMFASQMTWELYLQNEDFKKSTTDRMGIVIQLFYSTNNILTNFSDTKVLTYISGISLFVDSYETESSVHIFLNIPTEFPFKFVQGGLPEDLTNTNERAVVLGKKMKPYTYQKNGKDYFKVCEEEYIVTGYIAAEKSSSLDRKIFLFYNQLGQNAKRDIDYFAKTNGIFISMQDDKANLVDLYKEKEEILHDKVDFISFSNDMLDDTYDYDIGMVEYRKYSYLLYLFAITLIIMIMELWIAQRKKEFAIRRAVGYTRIQIIQMLAAELSKMIAYSGFLVLIIQIIIQWKSRTVGNENFILVNSVIYIVFTILTTVLLIIYPMYKIMQENIATCIHDKGI